MVTANLDHIVHREEQLTMEGLCTKHLSFSLLAKNLKKRSFEARSLHILGLSWDKFLILCSTPLLVNFGTTL